VVEVLGEHLLEISELLINNGGTKEDVTLALALITLLSTLKNLFQNGSRLAEALLGLAWSWVTEHGVTALEGSMSILNFVWLFPHLIEGNWRLLANLLLTIIDSSRADALVTLGSALLNLCWLEFRLAVALLWLASDNVSEDIVVASDFSVNLLLSVWEGEHLLWKKVVDNAFSWRSGSDKFLISFSSIENSTLARALTILRGALGDVTVLELFWLFWSLAEALLLLEWMWISENAVIANEESFSGLRWRHIVRLEEFLTHFSEVGSSTISVVDSGGAIALSSLFTTGLDDMGRWDLVKLLLGVLVAPAGLTEAWSNISEQFITALSLARRSPLAVSFLFLSILENVCEHTVLGVAIKDGSFTVNLFTLVDLSLSETVSLVVGWVRAHAMLWLSWLWITKDIVVAGNLTVDGHVELAVAEVVLWHNLMVIVMVDNVCDGTSALAHLALLGAASVTFRDWLHVFTLLLLISLSFKVNLLSGLGLDNRGGGVLNLWSLDGNLGAQAVKIWVLI
jgi:hypothetical protein